MQATNFLIILIVLLTILSVFLFLYILNFRKSIKKDREEIKSRMYELSILKEVGDRIEYSLSLENITDVIISSLSRFIDYSTAGYMLLSADKILFKVELKNSTSKNFIDDVKERMKDSLSLLLDKEIQDDEIEDTVARDLSNEKKNNRVSSFFNIPLVVGGNVMGILTIAHTTPGLYKEDEMTLLYKIVGRALGSLTRLENVIRMEQGKLGAMVDGMIDGVLMVDNDYRIIVANPIARNIANLNGKQDVTIFDFIESFGDKFKLKEKLQESVELGKILNEEEVVFVNNVFQVFVSPVTNKKDILGAVVVFHNITQVKHAEKIKTDFTSMLVHELRAPLDGIKKIGELMRSDESIRKNIETFTEYIGMVYESSSQMLELVNDLLDVSKIESGEFDLYLESSSVENIITERIKFFKALANGSKVSLSSFFAENIPKFIDIDRAKIAQVLNNLISNAIKFTRDGGSIFIQVFLHKTGNNLNFEATSAGVKWFIGDEMKDLKDCLVFAVTDTGDGISPENMAKLFNKFIQFESSARSGMSGTGLGLVIARGIVEAHEGILRVNSKRGEGSTFYFTINL